MSERDEEETRDSSKEMTNGVCDLKLDGGIQSELKKPYNTV